ncbi:hypothetical protein [Streptomyces sp. NBC_00239]|uniref:hypothetical protein n=1 Tax=Streptomyces sp. NBC_00239 TaxID=2903640 RepID=UPI002E2DC7EF|nr:hypothetical protein [Streptomyces sp. NBC_00239]
MPISMTTAGGLLLCRAEPPAVRPGAHLLRERLVLAPAGTGWSVLTPQDKPWRARNTPAGEVHQVGDVLEGWATALAVGTNWPVLGLWWDEGRTGFALAAGFRRTVAYGWQADGAPEGDPDALRTFAARLGLDPVMDMEDLEALTRPDAAAGGRARMLALIAVLARADLALPAGLAPGEPPERLRAAALVAPGAETVEWSGWRDAVRAELDAVDGGPLGPWVRGPRARLLGAAQLAAGAPLMLWGARRRSPGWAAAGAVLAAHGALSLAYDRARTAS